MHHPADNHLLGALPSNALRRLFPYLQYVELPLGTVLYEPGDVLSSNDSLRDLLLRYTQALINQMAQTAVCNRHHSVDQRLCRWLLVSLARLSSNQLVAHNTLKMKPGIYPATVLLPRAK
jgi:hypothetical protein